MTIKKLLIIFCLSLLCFHGKVYGETIRDTIAYKIVGNDTLTMVIFKPDTWKCRVKIPAMVFFFGGGWKSGNVSQFFPQAEILAENGMMVFLPDYRVRERQGTSPFESLSDAKSAIRFIRENSRLFHIDEDMIASGGGSAGGHLAAACACINEYDDKTDNLMISAKPDLLVLFNPVIDNSPEGYGYDRIQENYLKFSPMHNISGKYPDTLIMSGDKDKIVSVNTLRKFQDKIMKSGGICELVIFKNAAHGFFNKNSNSDKFFDETMRYMMDFLSERGYIFYNN